MNEKLVRIQQELKAPKSEFNKFAKYSYRSAENILEAVKPLVHKEGLTLTLDDEVVNIGNFNYVKATATLRDEKDEISTSAYAREEEIKKGMDSAQITGSTSSYARKYALSGLFAIDDNKDADSQDNTQHVTTKKPVLTGMASEKQRETIKNSLNKAGVAEEDIPGYLIENYGVDLPLTKEAASFIIDDLFGK